MKKLIATALILFVVIVLLVKFSDIEEKVIMYNNKDLFEKQDLDTTIEPAEEMTEEEKEVIIERLKQMGYIE
ncbi:hypothetical protein CMO90_00400 [Candidatus Woesearchaeota archaeon]|jgi:hypothetical protein|nr:hypothetical protein [Candidatus Woesearchaeota archaeon]|tara:strand:+ start:485 stop:700 length:216 start_codon:yes stop_codon:yes gene_type:complete